MCLPTIQHFEGASLRTKVHHVDCDAAGAPSAGFGVSFALGVVRLNDVRMLGLVKQKGCFVESASAAVLSDALALFRVIYE
ncbi:MAG: hypothetical protein ING66_13470 [Rhodocyclaceae bacterium]|nr:hypothetical protein [Rhodocyclaceae bacterium]MCA3019104.1 hypothetical protein [Rhodocyclaceae bacterium]MCA3025298.1 hypothetical protein [Rhodocyclaceae bacterium]MCA3029590.1 hypothetical protein [Rhodocyclaceae bacterium]MCA3032845.1 hypothetical protein [Rhodocyclaceae bacterium]